MKLLNPWIPIALLPGALLAQSTWIVDWTMGAGAHFQDIPQAVAAASAGDTILVRRTSSRYAAPLIDKPIAIVGVSSASFPNFSSVSVKGRWRIRNIGVGERVLISNIQFSGPVAPRVDPHGIECVNNAGSIHFEKVEMRAGGIVLGISRFEDCAALSFHGCRLEAYDTEVTFVRSRARLVDCDVFSSLPNTIFSVGISQTADAMLVRDSHVTMARSQAVGVSAVSGPGIIGLQPPRAGAHVESGTLVACADSLFLGGNSSACQPPFPPCPTSGIYGRGTVVLDPTVTFTNILNPALTVIRRHVPGLRMDLAFRGAPVQVGVVGPAQGFALLALGRPLSTPIAWPMGDLWLDPQGIVPVAFAALGSTGRWDLDLPVWSGTPIDRVFAFQAGVLFPGGATGLTTPVSFSVQWALGQPMP